jgi:hypothetical protein
MSAALALELAVALTIVLTIALVASAAMVVVAVVYVSLNAFLPFSPLPPLPDDASRHEHRNTPTRLAAATQQRTIAISGSPAAPALRILCTTPVDDVLRDAENWTLLSS